MTLIGNIPWNKGLSANTDERISRIGFLISESTKGRIPWNKGLTSKEDARVSRQGGRNGERAPWNKDLSKETDERLMRSAIKESIALKGLPSWKKGLTKETDLSLASASRKLKDQYANGRRTVILSRRYHDKQLGITFRSSWELKFARYLSSLSILWEYEKYSFMLSNGEVYIPDFYLPTADLFIEIKGNFRGVTDVHKPILLEKEHNKNVFIVDNVIYKDLDLEDIIE